MNNLTFGMEIIKSLENHLKDDFENIGGYDSTNKSLTVEPQWLA
jgi:hypothetical protein